MAMGLDWTTIIVALIASIPAAIIAWRTHKAVNSRMDNLLELLAKSHLIAMDAARKQGKMDEQIAQRAREEMEAK